MTARPLLIAFRTSIMIPLLVLVIFYMPLVHAQNFIFEEQEQGWLLKEDGKPRFFYQTATQSRDGMYPRSNYIHPLYGLDGEIITEDFPDDHLHHRGIFWAWHQLCVDGKKIADPWICEGIEWEITKVGSKIISETAVQLTSNILWKETEGEEREVVEENLMVTYERISPDLYKLTFDITLKPLLSNVMIGGSEDPKGYGGFSPRIKLSETVGFFDSKGKVRPQELAVSAGSWINITEREENDPGVVVMGEPDKLPSYQGWILRSKNSMQNMAFPGRNPVPLAGTPARHLTFRNQIIVHRGLENGEIEQHYKEFSK
ncbi:DUF6807 family protein [Negadavirga shengliensis]|uniref:DUF6807 family protein n=1 Tax=Negadavirga shengliensis TaxID=1389218 RepID=A0ABV9T712_9BACT